jgi:hypothetical protein
VEIPVIRDRQRRLLELERPGDQVIDAVRAIEKGVLRVAVQMDEGHLRKNSDRDPVRQKVETRWTLLGSDGKSTS